MNAEITQHPFPTSAFPEALKGKYQAYTQADLSRLREAGYTAPMVTVEEGVAQYIEWLHAHV